MATSETTTYISLFHSTDRAEAALNALEGAGFTRSSITSTYKNSTTGMDYSGELAKIGVPDRDLKHLQKGIEEGGVVISLQAAVDRSDDIERIFHKYSADKIDEADINRGGGFQEPFVAPVAPVSASRTGTESGVGSLEAADAVVPVVEEELIVGKRAVERGGVRVFRRTVEEPVTESVNLREEHVVIDRQPVDRAVTDADFASAGKTIELTETAEVPVVAKTARVVEEVRVGKVESDRTETVQDTVRRTEVDVQPVVADELSTGSGTSSASGTLPKSNRTGGSY